MFSFVHQPDLPCNLEGILTTSTMYVTTYSQLLLLPWLRHYMQPTTTTTLVTPLHAAHYYYYPGYVTTSSQLVTLFTFSD